MSMTVNSSTVNVSSNANQYETKIAQLEKKVQTYEAQLEEESEADKQEEIQTKIKNLKQQITTYQTKAASEKNNETDEKATTNTSNYNKPAATVEISQEGKVMSDSLKAMDDTQEKLKAEKEQEDKNDKLKEMKQKEEKSSEENKNAQTSISILV